MRRFTSVVRFPTVCGLLAGAVLVAYQTVPVLADDFKALAGTASPDQARQALAFLPSELWIHAGDSVTWSLPSGEPHTVTFLPPPPPAPIRPGFFGGCPPIPPGTQPSGTSYPLTPCVNSGLLFFGGSYTVQFSEPGNYKFVCLLHNNMTGLVHVLDPADPLPYDQAFYTAQGLLQANLLLAAGNALQGWGSALASQISKKEITAGIGAIVTTGGGAQTSSVLRFIRGHITVHVGDTVEWTNRDPITPHTVTFGDEPMDIFDPSADVAFDKDGALKTTLGAPGSSTNSGILLPELQDQGGQPQTAPGLTRFRVKFTQPGTFSYICALHDELGMKGQINVLP